MHFRWVRGIVFRIDMTLNRLIWILPALALLPARPAPAFLGEWELDTEQLSEAGQEIFERVAPPTIRQEYEFISAEELNELVAPMQQALAGQSLSELAAVEPQAKATLAQLRADPNTQGYADWLEARMDFFEMAAEEQRRSPAAPQMPPVTRAPSAPAKAPLPPHPSQPKPTLPPPPKTPQKALPPHPRPPAPSVKLPPHPKTPPAAPEPAAVMPSVRPQTQSGYADNKQSWRRKLKGRPAPARAAAMLPTLKQIFRAEGVPQELVWQAEAESTFNPAARSPVGAAGLYQFMPATAQAFGLSLSPEDERLDAVKNARAAAQYLKRLHGRFHSWPLALAAYNCGEGRLSKTLKKYNGNTFADIHHRLPAETRMYVPKIAALIQLREHVDLETL